MRSLIAISSCQLYEDKGYNRPARETWIPQLAASGFEYRFFFGYTGTLEPRHDDTIIVSCPDDYGSLCYKTLESLRWAYAQGFDYVFRAYPDTYIVPSRLKDSEFHQYDYSGNFEGGSMTAAGGPGYWLSRKAIEVMLEHEVSPTHPNIGSIFEDRWVGVIMNRYREELSRMDDRRYAEGAWLWGNTPLKENGLISAHLWGGEGKSNPNTFSKTYYDVHEKWLRSWA